MSDSGGAEDDEDDLPLVLIDFEFEVKLVRMVENILIPSKLSVRASVLPGEDNSSDQEMDAAFTKIKFWFDNLVGRSVAFARENAAAIAMLVGDDGANRSGNMLMITPDDPSDEHLAVLFQAKMAALAAGALEFGPVTVKSDNVIGLTFTFTGDSSEVLPSMADWIGERTFFDTPWWFRNDASTLDVTPVPDADLTKPPSWAYSLDFLSGLNKPNATDSAQGSVLRPNFKPTVIDGGKKD